MGFLDELGERFRDKTRDDVCAALRSLGVDAQMAERGRAEEEIGERGASGASLGIIDIPEGAIRWVHVHRYKGWGLEPGGRTIYVTDYGVTDPRLGADSPRLEIKSIRMKTLPLVGQVVDLRWEGEDFGLGIIEHLNNDASIKHLIMRNCDVKITTHQSYGCWIISTEMRAIPSRELWNCYQAIARHLLAKWSVIELDSKNAAAYYNRGITYAGLADYDQAITDYTKAIELDPNDADIYCNRGVAYDELGKYQQAIADYNKSIELDPNDAEVYYNRGVDYKQQGKKAEAITDFEKVIALSDDPLLVLEAQGLIEELTE